MNNILLKNLYHGPRYRIVYIGMLCMSVLYNYMYQ